MNSSTAQDARAPELPSSRAPERPPAARSRASWYAAIAVVVGRRRGARAGFLAFLAGPASGYVTLRYAERMQRIGSLGHARATLRAQGDQLGALRERRQAVIVEARRLLATPATPARIDAGAAAVSPSEESGCPVDGS